MEFEIGKENQNETLKTLTLADHESEKSLVKDTTLLSSLIEDEFVDVLSDSEPRSSLSRL